MIATERFSRCLHGLALRVVREESRYGTPRPAVVAQAASRTPVRRVAAALHVIAALVEIDTPARESWLTQLEHRGEWEGVVYLELTDGTEAEAKRGLEFLRVLVNEITRSDIIAEHTSGRSANYARGFTAGFNEVMDDGWTVDLARRYFESVGDPISEFDAGHQAGIRAALGIAEVSS